MATLAVRGSVPTSSVSAEIPEGPINGLLPELVGNILFLSAKNVRENTGLVCYQWQVLTLLASRKANQADVEQFTSKLVEKTDAKKHPQLKADCQEICQVSQSLNQRVMTIGQAEKLFLIINGFILRLLRKLTPVEKSGLEKSIGQQIPSSMGRIFELSSWNLEYAIESGDLNAVYVVLHSYNRIPRIELGQAVYQAVSNFQLGALQLLLTKGSISEADRGLAVCCAALNGQQNALQLLLTNGPISEADLEQAVQSAVQEDNLEALQLLLTQGQIRTMNQISRIFGDRSIDWETQKKAVRILVPYVSQIEWLFAGWISLQVMMIFGLCIYGINLISKDLRK